MHFYLSYLGEEPKSYGYGGTGKASTDCKFKDYGKPYVVGDVVTAYLVSNYYFCFHIEFYDVLLALYFNCDFQITIFFLDFYSVFFF